MNSYSVIPWRGMLLALLFSALTACAAPPPRPPMLGSHPWPTDSQGQLIEGTAMILALVNYHGLPVEACIITSSGNSTLDEEAIRRVGRTVFHPELIQGHPISGYVRYPITFALNGKSSIKPSTGRTDRRRVCETRPIAGVSAADLAIAQDVHLTIAPTQDGLVPGTTKPWSLDERGKPVHLGATERVLVDASGHLIESGKLISHDVHKNGYDTVNPAHDPARFPGFVQAASARLSTAVFATADESHWQLVDFNFGS